jgi:hypothetical protein
MDSSISTALVPIDRYFADGQELALAGFLAGYQGSTRDAYALDLRQFVVWCTNHARRLFDEHPGVLRGRGKRQSRIPRDTVAPI